MVICYKKNGVLLWKQLCMNSGHRGLRNFTFQVLRHLVLVEAMQQEVVQQV